jgi:hypothetical protein
MHAGVGAGVCLFQHDALASAVGLRSTAPGEIGFTMSEE